MSLDEPSTMNMWFTHPASILLEQPALTMKKKKKIDRHLIAMEIITAIAIIAWSIVFLRLFF